jgi:hypothetical protein
MESRIGMLQDLAYGYINSMVRSNKITPNKAMVEIQVLLLFERGYTQLCKTNASLIVIPSSAKLHQSAPLAIGASKYLDLV